MAVTHTFAIGREQCFQQIDKLIKSHSLHTSESLCKLLRYLAEHSLDHPGIALKEYQIATEVLGRPVGLIPKVTPRSGCRPDACGSSSPSTTPMRGPTIPWSSKSRRDPTPSHSTCVHPRRAPKPRLLSSSSRDRRKKRKLPQLTAGRLRSRFCPRC